MIQQEKDNANDIHTSVAIVRPFVHPFLIPFLTCTDKQIKAKRNEGKDDARRRREKCPAIATSVA